MEKFSKILIFGKGQVGSFYQEFLAPRYEVKLSDANITNENEVLDDVKSFNPDVVINTAGKTNIDWCEVNKLECFNINVLGADIVAKVAQENSKYLVHVSSGCVQESKDVNDVKKEDDQANPLCFYAWTKVWTEELVVDRMNRTGLKVLVLRPRQLISSKVSTRNAFLKMLTYTKFIDVPQSATVVEDLLETTEKLLLKDVTGVLNVANKGVISPFQIANMLKEIIKPEMSFEKISKEELNKMTYAQRIDCILSTDKLSSYGVELPEIQTRAKDIIKMFKENLAKDNAHTFEKTMEETKIKLSMK